VGGVGTKKRRVSRERQKEKKVKGTAPCFFAGDFPFMKKKRRSPHRKSFRTELRSQGQIIEAKKKRRKMDVAESGRYRSGLPKLVKYGGQRRIIAWCVHI